MERGVAGVLSHYFEAERARQTGHAAELGVAGGLDGVVEPFLVWNLNLALESLGRALVVRPDWARGAGVLVLLHASDAGLRRGSRRLEALPDDTSVQLVVYGDNAARESATWARRLVERHPGGAKYVAHGGGIDTGRALARSILQRQAIAGVNGKTRKGLLEVARRLRPSSEASQAG